MHILFSTCLFFCIFFSQYVYGQHKNLVPNSSFEYYKDCPSKTMEASKLKNWFPLPNHGGSVDFLHECATGANVGVPVNVFGREYAANGKSYIGLCLYLSFEKDFREYIQVKLDSPLIKGVYYEISFKYSLADNSNYFSNGLGVLFSNNTIEGPGNRECLQVKPDILFDQYFSRSVNWSKVTAKYKAKGGEQYMLIGGFLPDSKLGIKQVKNKPRESSYIYLDDISLKETCYLRLGKNRTLCKGEALVLDVTTGGATYLWQDGTTKPIYSIEKDGKYWVNITRRGCSVSDTITIDFLDYVNLGNDTSLCEGDTLILDAYKEGAYYIWQDLSNEPQYMVVKDGLYKVYVTKGLCRRICSLYVSYDSFPSVFLGEDTTLCQNDTIKLNAFNSKAKYWWQDSSTHPYYLATNSGLYWVEVYRNNCKRRDTIELTYKPKPYVNLGKDTVICQGDTIYLESKAKNSSIVWHDGSKSSIYKVTKSGTYWLTAEKENCISSDTIKIGVNQMPNINLGNDTILCSNVTLKLDVYSANATYLWQDNSSSSNYLISKPGIYWVKKSIKNCRDIDSIRVDYRKYPAIDLGPDTIVCNDEILILEAGNPGAAYLWQDHSQKSIYEVVKPGIYWVAIQDTNCLVSDTIEIKIKNCNCNLYVPSAFSPDNDNLNDEFYALTSCILNSFNLQIYNRWGEKVFETNDIETTWNGTYKGELSSTGVYYYQVQFQFEGMLHQKKIGFVTLLR